MKFILWAVSCWSIGSARWWRIFTKSGCLSHILWLFFQFFVHREGYTTNTPLFSDPVIIQFLSNTKIETEIPSNAYILCQSCHTCIDSDRLSLSVRRYVCIDWTGRWWLAMAPNVWTINIIVLNRTQFLNKQFVCLFYYWISCLTFNKKINPCSTDLMSRLFSTVLMPSNIESSTTNHH